MARKTTKQPEPKPQAPTVAQFVRANLTKDGSASYVLPGVRGRLRLRGSLFAKGVAAPETLTVNFAGFAPPDLAARKRVQERAQKAAERAKTAAERAAKLQARAERLALAAKEGAR